jgi:phosphoadenosine phosphosulfate reductase
MNLEELNKKYLPLTPEERIREIYKDFKNVLFTSSFGTTAIYLLHLFHKVKPEETIYFLDTTYHFNETIAYKEELTKLWNLKVVDVKPEEWKNKFTQEDQTWSKDPDLCCSINKVEPMDRIKAGFEVWVSGLMASQTTHRENLKIFEQKEDIIKFYPIIDKTEEGTKNYIQEHQLPQHPLLAHGFHSVGCVHCTVAGHGRTGRWANKSKTECGLHL